MTPKWCWLHNLSSILNRVQLFLTEANKASVPISSTIVNEFGEACKQAFIKQFSEERDKEFRPRMSSIGRPLCQLQMEKMGAKAETPSYNSKMRFILGDSNHKRTGWIRATSCQPHRTCQRRSTGPAHTKAADCHPESSSACPYWPGWKSRSR